MKKLLPLLLVLGALACGAAPRDEFLAAKRAATDANFRNDRAALENAVVEFQRLSADESLRAPALYHAAWTEWMIAATHFAEQKPAAALPLLESGIARLNAILAAHPDDAEAHTLLAWMLMAVGSADRARFPTIIPQMRTHRDRAKALAPQNPRFAMLEATMLAYSPKPESRDQGYARWREALALAAAENIADPLAADWGRTLGEGWFANILLTAQPPRRDEARPLLEKALRERPDWWWARTQALPLLDQPPAPPPAAPAAAPKS